MYEACDKQSVIYVFISSNSVRFVKSYGNWPPDGPNSVRLTHSVRYGRYGPWSQDGWVDGFLSWWLLIDDQQMGSYNSLEWLL